MQVQKAAVDKLPRGIGLSQFLQLTTHHLYHEGNRWRCHNCAISMSNQSLKQTLGTFGRYCRPLDEQVQILNDHVPTKVQDDRVKVGTTYLHSSHNLVYYRGIFVCLNCGNHAVQKPRKLAGVSPHRIEAAGRATLRRMGKGKPPSKYKEWPCSEQATLPFSMRKGSVELFAALARKKELQQEQAGPVEDVEPDEDRLNVSDSD